MKISKDEKNIVMEIGCTRDEIGDAIAVLEVLRKDMPVNNRPRFSKAKPEEKFLARCRRCSIRQGILNVEFKSC